jgi:hypothetical protein
LYIYGRVAGSDVARGTAVGTYPLFASTRDILVYNGDPASGGILVTDANFTFVVQAGGLTITPSDTDITNPPVGPGGGDGVDTDGGGDFGVPDTGVLGIIRSYATPTVPVFFIAASIVGASLVARKVYIIRRSNR